MQKWQEGGLGVLIDVAALGFGIWTVVDGIQGRLFLLPIGVPLALDGAWSLYRKARGRTPYENPERVRAIGALYLTAVWTAWTLLLAVRGEWVWALVLLALVPLELRLAAHAVRGWRAARTAGRAG